MTAEQTDAVSEYLICNDTISSLDILKCSSSLNDVILEIQRQLNHLKNNNIPVAYEFFVVTRVLLEKNGPIFLLRIPASLILM